MLNPTRLAAARKRRGWTLTKLAQETGLSRASLSTYENQHQDPTPQTLITLAAVLGVAEDFLTGDDLDEIPVEAVSFRALSKMTARTRDRGLNSGRIAILINEWLEDRFDLPAADVPTLTGRDPELAAQEVRARWGLGEQPIGNLVHLLEAHGIRIFSLTDDTKDLDAYCLNWHGQPFIFLSREKSGERHRFNAAHELGHLVLHGEDQTPNGPEAEAEANQFAAAFLMPKAGVLAQGLHNAHVQRILHAKKRWNVAAMAMAHRANELNLMTEWAYRTVCVDLSRMGYRRGEPGGIAHESSQLLTKAMQQLRAHGLGAQSIAADLGLHAAEVQAYMLGLTPTAVGGAPSTGGRTSSDHLRLVD
ncbi:helix-turn-helix domain-containing protein [Nocardioides cavernaquae]|uniref:ImmA/IrrE family metallo-endopeptidase n=1 Tax=Nocardioides cavernaquae TaxID=2321396 RepID=A0A3A5HIA7_9ACTN|nr:XRE family transcriptional regulator [Nocardioides cavernaquae]RJS47437.1 ImmA/IrrE family metallo-endopeptidase [Nocardioides cavernaquae]